MATQWQTFPVEFKGGLISNLSPLQHGTNAVGSATILQNFEVKKDGGYSKILGYIKYDSAAVTGTGKVLALKAISSTKIIAAREDGSETKYYKSSGSGWSLLTNGDSLNSLGGKVNHADFNLTGDDKVIFVDGVNAPQVYNTSNDSLTAISSSSVAAASHVVMYKNTAFYSVNNLLKFAAPYSVDDLSVTNGAGEINITQPITGLVVFRDQLIIFTKNSVKKLTGSSAADFTVSPIADNIGCLNGDTIQEIGGDIIYLAADGIRLLSATDRIGDFGLDIVSDKITKTATSFLNSTTQYCTVLLKNKAQYRVFAYVDGTQASASSGLIGTKFISQGGESIQWSSTKGIKAFVADSVYSGSTETIYFANEDGYIYQMDSGATFNGEAIESIYESPYMPLADPEVRKTFYKMTLYIEPTGGMDIDTNLKFDFSPSSDTAIVQPDTVNISSTLSNSIFVFGNSNARYINGETFTATANQTAFILQDNPYNVTTTSKVIVTLNGTEITTYTLASAADGSNYDITITLATGATVNDVVIIKLLPPSSTVVTTYGGQIDNVYSESVIGSGKTVALRVTDNSTNPTFTLDTAVFEYRQNDRQ